MARFTSTFAHVFSRPTERRERPSAPLLAAREPVLDDPDQAPRGPGWFDSSWDLQSGLEVREGLPGDAQLHEWIEACLRGAPVVPAAVLTACASA